MPVTSPTATTALDLADARRLLAGALLAAGHSESETAEIADHLLDCELRGLSFGGLARALSVIERRRECPPTGPVRTVRETPVSASVDGGDQVGYLVAAHAVALAIEKARTSGIAVVGARNTWYTGMFSYYLERVTAAGLVGMIAGSGPAMVAPHGGVQGRFGTNPIAFGFPTEGTPIIWDIGTSALMYGEAVLAERLGEPLRPGTAFDAEGASTTDPAAALAGALAVWGGHKGSGLALVVHLLGMLAGADADPPGISDCGFLAVVVDPAVLTDPADFRRRAGELADAVRASRPADPDEPVRVPFDRSIAKRAETLRRGVIEVATTVLETLRRYAA